MEAQQIAGPVILFLLMMVVGLELTPDDFRRVLAAPRAVVAGTVGQFVMLPFITVLVVGLLDVTPVFGAGAILVAVSPGAGMSNILAALAGANTALSVTLTAVTSVMSVLTLPVITSIAMRVFLAQEGDVDVPVLGLVAQLTASLLVPISIGMWIRTRRPETAARIAPRLHRITMVTIAVMVVLAVVLSDPGEIDFEGSGNALLAAAVWTAAAMATGWGIAAGLRLPNRDRFTFLIEFSTRNVAIATIVAMSGLDRIDLTLFSGLYFVTGYPMAVGAVLWRRRQYGLQGFRRRAPDETP